MIEPVNIPIKQYGKRELYQVLHERSLTVVCYRSFIDWVYSDPLAEELKKKPEIKSRKVLFPKHVKIIFEALI